MPSLMREAKGADDILLDGMTDRGCEAVQNALESGLISSKPLLPTLLAVASVVWGSKEISLDLLYIEEKDRRQSS